jgi:hypothetical protein
VATKGSKTSASGIGVASRATAKTKSASSKSASRSASHFASKTDAAKARSSSAKTGATGAKTTRNKPSPGASAIQPVTKQAKISAAQAEIAVRRYLSGKVGKRA